MQFAQVQEQQIAHEACVRLKSGKWLFKIGSKVLILETEEQKKKLLDKWIMFYQKTQPPVAIEYFTNLHLFSGLIYLFFRLFLISSSKLEINSFFADEFASYPQSSMAHFEFARSGEIVDVIQIKYVTSCFIFIIGLLLFSAGLFLWLSSSPFMEILEQYIFEYICVSLLFSVGGGSSMRYFKRILRTLHTYV